MTFTCIVFSFDQLPGLFVRGIEEEPQPEHHFENQPGKRDEDVDRPAQKSDELRGKYKDERERYMKPAIRALV
jgi:hypothetical protein